MPLSLLDGVAPDGLVTVSDVEAIECARQHARKEDIFAGFSPGAVVSAAMKLLENEAKSQTIAVVLADSGLKYLSTDLWA